MKLHHIGIAVPKIQDSIGELTEFFKFDKDIYLSVSSIIKYFGNLDISQRRMPLNGRFSTIIHNTTYDIRIST